MVRDSKRGLRLDSATRAIGFTLRDRTTKLVARRVGRCLAYVAG
jgi:hypothetical protein